MRALFILIGLVAALFLAAYSAKYLQIGSNAGFVAVVVIMCVMVPRLVLDNVKQSALSRAAWMAALLLPAMMLIVYRYYGAFGFHSVYSWQEVIIAGVALVALIALLCSVHKVKAKLLRR